MNLTQASVAHGGPSWPCKSARSRSRRWDQAWRIEYNTERPHRSLKVTPGEFARKSLLAGKTDLPLLAARSTTSPY
jgi:transposase InsO family protein